MTKTEADYYMHTQAGWQILTQTGWQILNIIRLCG